MPGGLVGGIRASGTMNDVERPELHIRPEWGQTGNVYFPVAAVVNGEWWVLRINNFPDHPLWTLDNVQGSDGIFDPIHVQLLHHFRFRPAPSYCASAGTIKPYTTTLGACSSARPATATHTSGTYA